MGKNNEVSGLGAASASISKDQILCPLRHTGQSCANGPRERNESPFASIRTADHMPVIASTVGIMHHWASAERRDSLKRFIFKKKLTSPNIRKLRPIIIKIHMSLLMLTSTSENINTIVGVFWIL